MSTSLRDCLFASAILSFVTSVILFIASATLKSQQDPSADFVTRIFIVLFCLFIFFALTNLFAHIIAELRLKRTDFAFLKEGILSKILFVLGICVVNTVVFLAITFFVL